MLRSTASILALAISTVSVSAAAQEAASASANPANDPAAPVPATSTADATRSPQADDGEIIVTAQKREQRLQDVPVVVSVLNQQQLENAGVRDVKDLQTITPGLNVTSVSYTHLRAHET